jgi:hypothetical protein
VKGRPVRELGLISLLLAIPVAAQEKETAKGILLVEPPPVSRAPLSVSPRHLPRRAKAQFPVLDMDPILVTFSPRATSDPPSALEIYDDVIRKVLRTVGFPDSRDHFRFPPDVGVRQYGANLRELAGILSPGTNETWKALLRPYGMDVTYLSECDDEILYPFVQVVKGVPIEHSFLVASRREGETVGTVSGSLIHHYEVVNQPPLALDQESATELAKRAFVKTAPGYLPTTTAVQGKPAVVLLPYGNAGERVIALRYAWRMIVSAVPSGGSEERFQLWVDADPQQELVLKMNPLTEEVAATGWAWKRQPLSTPQLIYFEVDPASTTEIGPQYLLQLANVFNRLKLVDAGGTERFFSVPAPGPADFSVTVPANPGCTSSGHIDFAQVSVFASLYRNWNVARSSGLYTEIRGQPWSPLIDLSRCSTANDLLSFSACYGYFHSLCPAYSNPSDPYAHENFLSFADDNTVVAHEMGHNVVRNLTNARPDGWCAASTCPTVHGFKKLHDLADAWADATEGTNCTGGWVARNQRNGAIFCAECDAHWSGSKLPRKHEVSWPATTTLDGFPEKRRVVSYVDPYADMEIAAAALWQVRNGMVSKAGSLGPALHLSRFTEALRGTGRFSYPLGSADIAIYDLLWDLERQLLIAWRADTSELGANTVNKVTSGFAKAGLFLVPSSCIDGIDGTCREGQPCNLNCPSGDHGADAVIDVEDNVFEDFLELDGFRHEENDFLSRDSPTPPTFVVWSGPEFKFDANGKAIPQTGASLLCNSRAKVQLSKKSTFRSATDSGWIDLNAGPGGVCPRGECFVATCYLEWTPDPVTWQSFVRSSGGNRIYYRAETTDGAGRKKRLSTRPGHGVVMPPPYVILTSDGRRP